MGYVGRSGLRGEQGLCAARSGTAKADSDGLWCQFGEFRLHGGSHPGVPSRGGAGADPALVCSISVSVTWGLSLRLPFPCPPHLLH